jgi:hypothetical protein
LRALAIVLVIAAAVLAVIRFLGTGWLVAILLGVVFLLIGMGVADGFLSIVQGLRSKNNNRHDQPVPLPDHAGPVGHVTIGRGWAIAAIAAVILAIAVPVLLIHTSNHGQVTPTTTTYLRSPP